MAKEILFELRKVSKRFGGLHAVREVDIAVEKGSIHGLIGPNGAGKTTAFNTIIGILPVTSGNVVFKGHDITKYAASRRVKEGISIKMQIPGVFSELSLYDNLKTAIFPYVHKNEVESEIERLIEMVGIGHLGNPLVKNMSHGQQQWLEIAMALASKPELLLLDEPAAGLGLDETEFTIDLIKRVNEEGVTIVFIDHNIDFVKELADRITVMHYGQVFAEGTVEEIVNNEHVKEIYLGKA